MATYLVTGVAGFIASRVAERLLEAGHVVIGVDNLNNYYDVRLKDHRLSKLLGLAWPLPGTDAWKSVFASAGSRKNAAGTFIFHALDVENQAALEAVFAAHQFSAVFNLAARAGVRYSMENPYVYLSTNTLGTLNVLECMRKHGVKKHILASTSSLYAGCAMPFNEDQPVNTPLSPYAATKKAAEMMCHSYHKLYGLDMTILRYFTVFGPAGRPDMSIFRFIKWIDEGRQLELYGDGTQSRDFTYVDDIARGTILATKPLGFEIINLGGGNNPIDLQSVIRFIENALGKKAKIDERAVAPADIKSSWADIAKAKSLLGWEPEVSTEDGFRRTIAWYQANRDWLATVRL